MLKVLVARLDTTLRTERELAEHSGCGGDKNLPDAVFHFTDIAIQLHEHLFIMWRTCMHGCAMDATVTTAELL